ncbi:hypothetical protein BV898_02283 [Hypsibius exemplaris]|uniref:WH1 domain-containing protein n=1 Tax=Hypsibius exemplaris TaxID=2072580 RepID=A0A1W0X8R3_HYPEX|nr:hypothetical protein BV898_02283 [Hypsibius exemplaris]
MMPGLSPYSSDFSATSRSGHTSPDSGGDFATSSIYSSSHGGGGGGGAPGSASASGSGGYPASLSSLQLHENSAFQFGLLSETLADEEIAQIESFYKGLYSHVFVCPSVAALYLFREANRGANRTATAGQSSMTTRDGASNKQSQLNRSDNRMPTSHQQFPPSLVGLNRSISSGGATTPNPQKTGWTLEFSTGVPVVVHVTRPGRQSVHFIFAERATGFPLWQDSHLTPSSKYTCIDSDYHEFVATANQTRVGLRFGAASAASKFLQQVVSLIANPATFGEVKSSGRRQAQTTPKKTKQQPPKKSSISPPCCFQHRTHVAKEDELRSLADFVGSVRKNIFPSSVDSRTSMVVSSKIYGTCR